MERAVFGLVVAAVSDCRTLDFGVGQNCTSSIHAPIGDRRYNDAA